MLIKNCRIIYKDKIEEGSVHIENGKIKEINPKTCEDKDILDAEGLYLSPGFIDIHIHGAGGCDTMDCKEESLNTISKAIAAHGTTAFLPTTMTMPIDTIHKALKKVKNVIKEGTDGAQILGVHLEGPFINEAAIGAQNKEYLLKPSVKYFKNMTCGFEDLVKSVTLAPELDDSNELIKYLSSKNIVSCAGHTKSCYDDIVKSCKDGLSHVTHLFNAMTGFSHREPGVVGAAFDTDMTAEVICDGVHSSYASLRIAFKQKTTDNMILISDAMMACCMENGKYSLGGQDVFVKDGEARLKNNALAGSVLTLDKAVSNVYKYCNIPLYEAVKMASYNPAKFCRADDTKGLIKEGYDADILLFDENINIKKVFIRGKRIV